MNSDDQSRHQPEADDLEQEAEALRKCMPFQRFLDERSRSQGRVPLEMIEEEIDREITDQAEES